MMDSKIKHLLNVVIWHWHMYRKQYHIYKTPIIWIQKKIGLEEQNC